jgi:threonine dehydrogenase-like Zn-dependent dehydrogenase
VTKLARAVVMSGLTLETREYPVPEPAPGTILLRQELCGVCGTDVHNWEHRRFSYEVAMGHEPVGIVEKLGAGVTADYFGKPLEVGDRVIVAPGTPHGAYGFQVADEQPYFRSGFADYIYLAIPETFVYKTGLPASVAVLAEPFTIGVHAVMRAKLSFGDTVVIQGSGAIGLMTLACAKLSGAGRLIVVGGPPARLALARRMGADVTIDIGEVRSAEERTRLVMEQTLRGEGADAVFECAGVLPAVPEGLGYLRRYGTYVEVGHFVDVGSMEFNINQWLMRRNLRLEAVYGSDQSHFVAGMPVFEKNEFPFSEMVSHVLPLDRAADAFKSLQGAYKLDGKDVVKIALAGSAS